MGKGYRWIVGFILLLTLASLPVFAEERRITIRLEEHVTVGAGHLRLSDIAIIQGATIDEEKLFDTIELGKAPAAGQSRSITRQYVSFKLAQAGLKEKEIQLEMPEQVKVTGDGIQLTTEILQRLIEDSVRSEVPKLWTSWQMKFGGGFNSRWVPPGELTAEIETGSDALGPGINLLKIKVMSDGEPVLRMAVAIRIDAIGKVPVLQNDLEKHSRLLASNISWEERTLKGREILILKEEDLRTTRRLRKGEVINRADLETVPFILKGTKVQIVFHSDGASVMVYGIARTDGWLGQNVSVENIDSKKAISATVVAEGRVEVK